MRKRLFRLPWRSLRDIRDDFDDELAFHITERAEALMALGETSEAANARAVRELGDVNDARRYVGAVDRTTEAARRRSEYMRDLIQDIAYAARKLRAAPVFTAAAVLTLALGIGATTAMFSVVDTVLLRPLPFPEPDRLVRLRFTQQGHGDAGTPMDLIDYRTHARNFTGFAALEGTTANLARDAGDAERLVAARVSANWFDVLRVKPVVGRFFAPADEAQGAPMTIVLSEALWRRDFSADPGVVGKIVRINAVPRTVIGVAPAGQQYPVTAELWMAKQWEPGDLSDGTRGARWLTYLARIRDDADPTAARAEVHNISVAMEKRFPEDFRERRVEAVPLHDYMVGDMRKPLLVIFAAVVFVLLIAAANVANLLLVRAQARESEMAIRTALGAGRGRIARQLLTESVLLSIVGGALGVVVAKIGMTKLLGLAPAPLLLIRESSIDAKTLAVAMTTAVATGLIFGLLPAFQAARSDLSGMLRAGGRGTDTRHGTNGAKRVIVVAELALAVVLLSGAGLLLRSFARLTSVDPGFRPEGVLTMKFVLPYANYDSDRVRQVVRTIETRAAALPGVENVAIASEVPLDEMGNSYSFAVRGQIYARSSDKPSTAITQIDGDYLRAMGIPIVEGRGFAPTDDDRTQKVFVVNQTFAKRYFAGSSAVGQEIRLDWARDPKGETYPVVGVVGDVHVNGLDQEPEPLAYAVLSQYPTNGLTVVVRSKNPASVAAPLRAIVRDIDREVPIYSVMTMEERMASSVGPRRFYASLIVIFAAVALTLAGIGLYGLIAYAVNQRTHELGVRVALGATTEQIARMVVAEGLKLAVVGVGIGIVGALLMGRVVSSLLFDVSARDPMTLGGVAITLATIAALASWLPARRAARVDPLTAIRGD